MPACSMIPRVALLGVGRTLKRWEVLATIQRFYTLFLFYTLYALNPQIFTITCNIQACALEQ